MASVHRLQLVEARCFMNQQDESKRCNDDRLEEVLEQALEAVTGGLRTDQMRPSENVIDVSLSCHIDHWVF